jgi:hypothetical protein
MKVRKVVQTDVSRKDALLGCPANPKEWLREGIRLVEEAERTNLAKDWKAATAHFVGIVVKLEVHLR